MTIRHRHRHRIVLPLLLASAMAMASGCGPLAPDEGDGAGPASPVELDRDGSPIGELPQRPVTPALQRIASDLGELVAVGPAAREGRLWLADRSGVLLELDPQDPGRAPVELNLRDRVGSRAGEQGLLQAITGPAPGGTTAAYLSYTDTSGDSIVSRMQLAGGMPDPATEQVLLRIPQPFSNHNGGHLAFGPDDLLYVGTGDGGSAGDPGNRAQDPADLLGKMLRIDVTATGDGTRAYGIPPGNPYAAGGDGAPEVLMTGLRNPWRYAFDPATDLLLVADVGQNAVEEVTTLTGEQYAERPAGDPPNLEWAVREGDVPFREDPGFGPGERIGPAYTYRHPEGCSITGGEVIRGDDRGLRGLYVFADWCADWLGWAPIADAGAVPELGEVRRSPGVERITSFGQGPDGVVYAVTGGGDLYAVVGGSADDD